MAGGQLDLREIKFRIMWQESNSLRDHHPTKDSSVVKLGQLPSKTWISSMPAYPLGHTRGSLRDSAGDTNSGRSLRCEERGSQPVSRPRPEPRWYERGSKPVSLQQRFYSPETLLTYRVLPIGHTTSKSSLETFESRRPAWKSSIIYLSYVIFIKICYILMIVTSISSYTVTEGAVRIASA